MVKRKLRGGKLKTITERRLEKEIKQIEKEISAGVYYDGEDRLEKEESKVLARLSELQTELKQHRADVKKFEDLIDKFFKDRESVDVIDIQDLKQSLRGI